MRRERSQQIAEPRKAPEDLQRKGGALFVVGVPIGHPDDITVRGLRVLREATLIASEDPVATQRLLAHHRIQAIVTSYGPANIKAKVALLIHRLLDGARVALVSDSGSPVIADPGQLLVSAARSRGIPVFSLPGPSALTATLSVSGFSGDSFSFSGLLPEKKSPLEQCLANILKRPEQTVAFCSARSLNMIVDVIKRLASRRTIVLACDLTKPEEVVIRGTAHQVQKILAERPAAQEITLMIAGRTAQRKNRKKKPPS
jgi:16S rRNA (cytidine1402-2'-O)-methyltransferase